MDHLLKFRDSFIGFLTPGAKRRHTINFPSTPNHNARSTMPGTATEPRTQRTKGVLAGRISKNYQSAPGAKRSARGASKHGRVNSDDADYAEEESDIGDEWDNEQHINAVHESRRSESLHPDESASQVAGRTTSRNARLNMEEEEYEPEEQYEGQEDNDLQDGEHEGSDDELNLDPDVEAPLAVEEKVAAYLANQAIHASEVKADLAKASSEGWHADEVELFERLAMRGYEPLLPMAWARDFPTLPDHLFGKVKDGVEERTVFNAISGNDFRGK